MGKEELPLQYLHQCPSVWRQCFKHTSLWRWVLGDIPTTGIKVECLSLFESVIYIRQNLGGQDDQWWGFQDYRLRIVFIETEILLPTLGGTYKQDASTQKFLTPFSLCAKRKKHDTPEDRSSGWRMSWNEIWKTLILNLRQLEVLVPCWSLS